MFSWSSGFSILNHQNYKPSFLSSNLYSQCFLFRILMIGCTDQCGRLITNSSLTNLTRASCGLSRHQCCSHRLPQRASPGVAALICIWIFTAQERWVAAFKPWPLGPVPLQIPVSPGGGLKQPCPNILCWWSCNQSLRASWLTGEEQLGHSLQCLWRW